MVSERCRIRRYMLDGPHRQLIFISESQMLLSHTAVVEKQASQAGMLMI